MTKLTIILCAFIATTGCADTAKPKKTADAPGARIGTYDSRAIAVASVGSKVFKQYMADLQSRHEKAKAAGDSKLIAKLEAEGASQQKLLHKQGFSTAPVDNILEHIADQLPKIKEQAKVDIIVSKWNEKELSKHKSAELTDITMALVEAFEPNAKQKKHAVEIQKHKPVPLEQMKSHKH